MYEGPETMDSPPTYQKGDIVWVKLSGCWWPGEVKSEEDLPRGLLSDFKRPPLVIVQFFDEDSYEYIKSWSTIYPYNCDKKSEFIKKGMAGYRAKLSHMAKFPRDIGMAEERTNGDPNILSQPEFLPMKKINYDEIFGTPSPKKSSKSKVSSSASRKSAAKDFSEPLVTHRRFLGNDDYKAYICVQYIGKDRTPDSEDEEIQMLNKEPEEILTCPSCSFETKRLGVMLMHTKMHLEGAYVATAKRKTKKVKEVYMTDSEAEATTPRPPKPKQRKKKQVVESKPTDVFTNLLEEWDDTDDEVSVPPKTSETDATKSDIENNEDKTESNDIDEGKSATNNALGSSEVPEVAKPDSVRKNTHDDIKNCFDFDEEEEEDEFLLPASAGRKIPRVIPEKPRTSISELLELSQKEDDMAKEKMSESKDKQPDVGTPAEVEADANKKEILRISQSFNRAPNVDEATDNSFKELMEETELPALDDLTQSLKPEQNFHDARTIKFPDKGGTTMKGGAAQKSGTPKKRFVTSFEDFEAGFRKIEDERKRLTGDKEGKRNKKPKGSPVSLKDGEPSELAKDELISTNADAVTTAYNSSTDEHRPTEIEYSGASQESDLVTIEDVDAHITGDSGIDKEKTSCSFEESKLKGSDIAITSATEEVQSVEVQSLAVPSVEVSSVEVPSVEVSIVEVSSVEVPVVEVPSVEVRSVEVPSVEVPSVEVPSVEVPSVEVPSVEVPSVEDPIVEVPSVEVPSVEDPSVEVVKRTSRRRTRQFINDDYNSSTAKHQPTEIDISGASQGYVLQSDLVTIEDVDAHITGDTGIDKEEISCYSEESKLKDRGIANTSATEEVQSLEVPSADVPSVEVPSVEVSSVEVPLAEVPPVEVVKRTSRRRTRWLVIEDPNSSTDNHQPTEIENTGASQESALVTIENAEAHISTDPSIDKEKTSRGSEENKLMDSDIANASAMLEVQSVEVPSVEAVKRTPRRRTRQVAIEDDVSSTDKHQPTEIEISDALQESVLQSDLVTTENVEAHMSSDSSVAKEKTSCGSEESKLKDSDIATNSASEEVPSVEAVKRTSRRRSRQFVIEGDDNASTAKLMFTDMKIEMPTDIESGGALQESVLQSDLVTIETPISSDTSTDKEKTSCDSEESKLKDSDIANTSTTEEVQSVKVPSVEVPTDEVPSVEVPSVQAPSVEGPSVEVPSVEDLLPPVEVPSVEVPSVEVPSVEVPSVEVPTVDVPSVEVPSVEVPTVEVPSAEVPSVEVPSVEVPSAGVPSVEVPSVEVPSIEVPTVEVRSVEVPSVEGPSVNVPSVEVSSIEVPTVEVRSFEIPSVEGPSVEVPSVEVVNRTSRRRTRQFVIEDEFEEIIEFSEEDQGHIIANDLEVVDSGKEVTRELELDAEIEAIQRDLEISQNIDSIAEGGPKKKPVRTEMSTEQLTKELEGNTDSAVDLENVAEEAKSVTDQQIKSQKKTKRKSKATDLEVTSTELEGSADEPISRRKARQRKSSKGDSHEEFNLNAPISIEGDIDENERKSLALIAILTGEQGNRRGRSRGLPEQRQMGVNLQQNMDIGILEEPTSKRKRHSERHRKKREVSSEIKDANPEVNALETVKTSPSSREGELQKHTEGDLSVTNDSVATIEVPEPCSGSQISTLSEWFPDVPEKPLLRRGRSKKLETNTTETFKEVGSFESSVTNAFEELTPLRRKARSRISIKISAVPAENAVSEVSSAGPVTAEDVPIDKCEGPTEVEESGKTSDTQEPISFVADVSMTPSVENVMMAADVVQKSSKHGKSRSRKHSKGESALADHVSPTAIAETDLAPKEQDISVISAEDKNETLENISAELAEDLDKPSSRKISKSRKHSKTEKSQPKEVTVSDYDTVHPPETCIEKLSATDNVNLDIDSISIPTEDVNKSVENFYSEQIISDYLTKVPEISKRQRDKTRWNAGESSASTSLEITDMHMDDNVNITIDPHFIDLESIPLPPVPPPPQSTVVVSDSLKSKRSRGKSKWPIEEDVASAVNKATVRKSDEKEETTDLPIIPGFEDVMADVAEDLRKFKRGKNISEQAPPDSLASRTRSKDISSLISSLETPSKPLKHSDYDFKIIPQEKEQHSDKKESTQSEPMKVESLVKELDSGAPRRGRPRKHSVEKTTSFEKLEILTSLADIKLPEYPAEKFVSLDSVPLPPQSDKADKRRSSRRHSSRTERKTHSANEDIQLLGEAAKVGKSADTGLEAISAELALESSSSLGKDSRRKPSERKRRDTSRPEEKIQTISDTYSKHTKADQENIHYLRSQDSSDKSTRKSELTTPTGIVSDTIYGRNSKDSGSRKSKLSRSRWDVISRPGTDVAAQISEISQSGEIIVKDTDSEKLKDLEPTSDHQSEVTTKPLDKTSDVVNVSQVVSGCDRNREEDSRVLELSSIVTPEFLGQSDKCPLTESPISSSIDTTNQKIIIDESLVLEAGVSAPESSEEGLFNISKQTEPSHDTPAVPEAVRDEGQIKQAEDVDVRPLADSTDRLSNVLALDTASVESQELNQTAIENNIDTIIEHTKYIPDSELTLTAEDVVAGNLTKDELPSEGVMASLNEEQPSKDIFIEEGTRSPTRKSSEAKPSAAEAQINFVPETNDAGNFKVEEEVQQGAELVTQCSEAVTPDASSDTQECNSTDLINNAEVKDIEVTKEVNLEVTGAIIAEDDEDHEAKTSKYLTKKGKRGRPRKPSKSVAKKALKKFVTPLKTQESDQVAVDVKHVDIEPTIIAQDEANKASKSDIFSENASTVSDFSTKDLSLTREPSENSEVISQKSNSDLTIKVKKTTAKKRKGGRYRKKSKGTTMTDDALRNVVPVHLDADDKVAIEVLEQLSANALLIPEKHIKNTTEVQALQASIEHDQATCESKLSELSLQAGQKNTVLDAKTETCILQSPGGTLKVQQGETPSKELDSLTLEDSKHVGILLKGDVEAKLDPLPQEGSEEITVHSKEQQRINSEQEGTCVDSVSKFTTEENICQSSQCEQVEVDSAEAIPPVMSFSIDATVEQKRPRGRPKKRIEIEVDLPDEKPHDELGITRDMSPNQVLSEMLKEEPSKDKGKLVPPKKNKWSRRGSYGKKDPDNEESLAVKDDIQSISQTKASEQTITKEGILELENTVIEKTDHSSLEANTPEDSSSSFIENELILPLKKSKRFNETSSQFLTDSFSDDQISPEKKFDDTLCFPSYDDSFMSTSLRNNIEGLIKEIDSIDNVMPDSLDSSSVDSEGKQFDMSQVKMEGLSSTQLFENMLLPHDSSIGGLKENIDLSKCVPPKKKKIELPKEEPVDVPLNNLIQNDFVKSDEKVIVENIPQAPKKKMQKLFENSQVLEKSEKSVDLPLMSPLAKKKSFLFQHEEFDAQEKQESDASKEVAGLSHLDQKPLESADVVESQYLNLQKIRKKRKSSSQDICPPKKEKLEVEVCAQEVAKDVTDSLTSADSQNDFQLPLNINEEIKPNKELENKMENKIADNDTTFFKVSTPETHKAEELTGLSTPEVIEHDSKEIVVPQPVKSEKDVAASLKSAKDDIVMAKEEAPLAGITPKEPELVSIAVAPTVMSEKDLADAQVEITTDKVISEKKPATVTSLTMDFSEPASKSGIVKIKKQSDGTKKVTETVGTEFTSKAMLKEFDNRSLTCKPNAYVLKSELLDILEGNSNSSTNSSGSEKKFKTSYDNYDKNKSTVQGIIDFEDAIPSQIVLSNKVSPESVLIDSPKLLERLSMSAETSKPKIQKLVIQSDVKVPESLSKALISKVAKPAGVPKPGQKIVIKTSRPPVVPAAKVAGSKPIILSEQIIRPASSATTAVKSAAVQSQGLKRHYEDIEDVETAFIIPKIAKKAAEEEVIVAPTLPEKPARSRGPKTSGKAKIIQQTIISPKGKVLPQAATTTTTIAPSIQLQTIQVQAAQDDSVFDINSMPIVLSDDLLTPESIQNMPVVLSEDVLPQNTTVSVAKPPAPQEKLLANLPKKIVSTLGSKQIIFKTTQPGSTTPMPVKHTTPVPAKHVVKPRILSTSGATPHGKVSKPGATAIVATGTMPDGKPAKYVLVPPSVTPATTQVKTVKQAIIKKPLVAQSKVAPPTGVAPVSDSSGQIVGNKIMIVTNAQGQQTRVVLTPQQHKAFMQAQSGAKAKTIIKGAIPKALLESAAAASPGPSGVVVPKTVSVTPQGTSPTVSSHGGLLMPAVKGVKTPLPPKKAAQRPAAKPQKTILIKNQMGQTVRKIQGTDDADLDRQVAEQLEAIKASARLQQANKSPEIINYTNRPIPATNRSTVRRYSKKIEPPKIKIPAPTPQVDTQKQQQESLPALAPLSPQPRLSQVQSQTPQSVPKHQGSVKKADPPAPSPVISKSSTDTVLQKSQTTAPVKPDNKQPAAAPPKDAVETKRPESPLRQVVIQDGLGNLTTVTVGQILAIPSETVDGQPQSYMLVTVDESGNLTPLNNDALMSLDPSLGAAGDLSNVVLQVDQGQGTVTSIKPAETSPATVAAPPVAEKKVEEKLPQAPKPPQPVKEPKVASVEKQKPPHEVPLAVEQQIVIGEGVLPGDAGGQQLIVTGDPIATQKFLESLSDGSTDLANILANAEGGSVIIQADGQQILIRTNPTVQPMMGITESSESGGNPMFATHKPNQDILAAALANTDVFQPADQQNSQSTPLKGLQSSQLSPGGGAALYPMHVSNVLETSLTLNSPIMTPLEVPSTNTKKIDDEADILNQVPKNVDLPITITDPNISQTVAQQSVNLMELNLPISETGPGADIHSPSYSYSLPTLDESVGISQKSFGSSMPLLTEDLGEVESNTSSDSDRIKVSKGLETAPSSFTSNFGSLPMLSDAIQSSREEVVKTSTFGDIGSLALLSDDVIEDSGSSIGSTKPARSSPKVIERDIVDEGLSTLGGEMCSSLSEPPPDMFDLTSITHKEEEISSDISSIPEQETLSINSENSGEIPIQPPIVASLNDLKRPSDDSDGSDDKRPRFD